LAVVRAFSDSLRTPFDPLGKAINFPAAIAQAASLAPEQIIYSPAGGEQPQSLVNELSNAIANGDVRTAMIVGSEANSALKTALKRGIKLDWSNDVDAKVQDRGPQTNFLSAYEVANGIGLPPQTYAVLEQALRARLGMKKTEYLDYIAQICAALSKTAEQNSYAQFPHAMSRVFLAEPSKKNYPISDPYLKWHVS
jgi:acetyl-CoA C-acetyltransferase